MNLWPDIRIGIRMDCRTPGWRFSAALSWLRPCAVCSSIWPFARTILERGYGTDASALANPTTPIIHTPICLENLFTRRKTIHIRFVLQFHRFRCYQTIHITIIAPVVPPTEKLLGPYWNLLLLSRAAAVNTYLSDYYRLFDSWTVCRARVCRPTYNTQQPTTNRRMAFCLFFILFLYGLASCVLSIFGLFQWNNRIGFASFSPFQPMNYDHWKCRSILNLL